MSASPAPLRSRLPRIAEAAVRRARLTVVPRPVVRRRAPRVPFVILVSAILLGGVVGLLLFNTSMQQASFRATALEQQARDLSAQQESLEMQLQDLRDPKRVAREAQRAGMVIPQGPAGVIDLRTGTITGDPEPAPAGSRLPLELPGETRPAVLDPDPVTVRRDAGGSGGGNTGDDSGDNGSDRNERRDGAPNRR